MDLQFNELSAPCADEYVANAKMEQFAKTFAKARQREFLHIRSESYMYEIELANKYSIHDWLCNKDIPKNLRDFLFGVFQYPFIEGDDVEEQYSEASYFFEDKENGIEKVACIGLAGAYLRETLSISLSTHSVWDKVKLPIIIEKDNDEHSLEVLNISSETSFEKAEIAEFIENAGNLTLIQTPLLPDDKKTHLTDHHGKPELEDLCNQLKNSPYVVEMRSIDWGGKKFIRKCKKDGVVEIVLFKTQRQYALRVQTTGRNLIETKAIAEILEEKYS